MARQAAEILRERYDATRIRVFGCLVHPDRLHAGSDVDLAVEDVSASIYWDAVTDVSFLIVAMHALTRQLTQAGAAGILWPTVAVDKRGVPTSQ